MVYFGPSMNTYELTLFLKPEEKEADKALAKVKGWIEAGKGKVEKVDKWGLKDLAYPVKKLNQGFFVLLSCSATPEGIASLTRRLRTEPEVVRHLLIRV